MTACQNIPNLFFLFLFFLSFFSSIYIKNESFWQSSLVFSIVYHVNGSMKFERFSIRRKHYANFIIIIIFHNLENWTLFILGFKLSRSVAVVTIQFSPAPLKLLLFKAHLLLYLLRLTRLMLSYVTLPTYSPKVRIWAYSGHYKLNYLPPSPIPTQS